MCGPGYCGREVIAVSLMLSRNEVTELSEAELTRLIRIQRWNPGSRSVDPKGSWTRRLYPHSSELLMIKEQTEIRPSSSKDFEEEVVWRAFTEFDMPGKVLRTEWDSSSPMGEIIWRDQRSK